MIQVWRNAGWIEELHDWAADGGSSAQLPAATTLEFIDRILRPVPDLVAPYTIEEIDVRPSKAFGKKGSLDYDEMQKEELTTLDFFAFPNPFTGMITFETQGRAGSIQIIDLRGVIMAKLDARKDALTLFNGNALSAGIYIAVFADSNGNQHAFRIIKQ